MTDVDRVTWRLEIPAGWGQRLDPAWLPSSSGDDWRRIFETEDLAGRFFAAGGAGSMWKDLAHPVAGLAEVLAQYRMQWLCAEEVARTCPVAAPAHLAAMAVPRGLRPPRRSSGDGTWRVCVLQDDRAATVATYPSIDLAEGAAVAHRALAGDRVVWAEPAARGPAPDAAAETYRIPEPDTDLRLTAFAAEDAVADVTRAAATGHLGPDVLDASLLCTFGEAAHYMIREYRTLFRAVWDDLERCSGSVAHDDDAEAMLQAAVPEPERGPGGRWQHVELRDGRVTVVARLPGRSAAAASVAAYRATDGTSAAVVRWSEPALRFQDGT